jgi:hypothetical protein
LNKSSNAFLALEGLDGWDADLVSRSTVVRGSKNVHVLRASFGETRAGIGFWHSKGALVSKCVHWAQLCRSLWQRGTDGDGNARARERLAAGERIVREEACR